MHGLRHFGGRTSGWVVPSDAIRPGWVCYTAGVGEDAGFDVALADRGCEVVAIDPTPRARRHIQTELDAKRTLRLLPYALWCTDEQLRFYEPANPEDVSYSIGNLQNTRRFIEVPGRTLESIRTELGHIEIHLLKLDIEGAEYEVLATSDLRALGVRVLCVEFHGKPSEGIDSMLAAVERVRDQGYAAVAARFTDVTFVRTDVLDESRRPVHSS